MAKRTGGRRWRGPVTAGIVAVLAAVAAVAVLSPWLSDSDDSDDSAEPRSWSSNDVTLNTGSWKPGDDEMQMGIGGVVRIDSNGCVYLGSPNRPNVVTNVIWPAGYTASRESDGTVNILDPDGVVVAATGHRLDAGGGAAEQLGYDLACAAEGTTEGTVMITYELPPLNRRGSARPESNVTG